MKKNLFILLILFSQVFSQVFASETISKNLMKEWNRFRPQVDALKPDGDIGGYMLYRDYQDMTLLWRTSTDPRDNEVIRFFMERPDGTVFAVTYYKSDVIFPERVVLRRFVGTEPTGWINHTIDFESGAYLGSQGEAYEPTTSEKKMMSKWGIKNF